MDIFSEYLALCWFEGDPMELPRSTSLFKKGLFIYFLVYYLLQANMTDDPFESIYEVLLQITLMLVFIGVMLSLNKTMYVYIQVSTAILFSANVLSIFLIPIMVWLTVSEDPWSYYFFGVIVLWYFAIVAYIFKYSLLINVPASMVLSLLYFIGTYLGAFALGQMF
jgi:hypothetical protein